MPANVASLADRWQLVLVPLACPPTDPLERKAPALELPLVLRLLPKSEGWADDLQVVLGACDLVREVDHLCCAEERAQVQLDFDDDLAALVLEHHVRVHLRRAVPQDARIRTNAYFP